MGDKPKRIIVVVVGTGVHAQALAASLTRLASIKHLIEIAKSDEEYREAEKKKILTAFDNVEVNAQVAMAEAMKDMEIVAKKATPVIEPLGKVVDSLPTKMKHHNYWPLGKKQGGRKHKKHCR